MNGFVNFYEEYRSLMLNLQQEKRLGVRAALVLFIVGLTVLILRNPDPLLHPSMYTEDGVWSGYLYRIGPAATYLNARPDYLVIGNIFLLQLSVLLNNFLTDNTIDYLPLFVSAVSFVFYSSFAVFVFVSLKPFLSSAWRLACWGAVLLLPMGAHMNEMLGRLSNTGYAFYVIATLALILRNAHPVTRLSKSVVALDALALFCALTNPLSALLMLGMSLVCLCRKDHRASANTYILVALTGVGLASFAIGFLTPRALGADIPYTFAGLVAAGLARPLLYPFLFPVYTWLNDSLVITLAFLLGLSLSIAWWFHNQRLAYGFLLVALGVVTGATALARPEIHGVLIGYHGSFPDRYFYAQNIIVSIAFLWGASSLSQRFNAARVVTSVTVGSVAGVWVIGATTLFDPFVPATVIRTGPSFAEQVAAAPPSGEFPGNLTVYIYPQPLWHGVFPSHFQRE